jgi:hypothetical protein
LLRVVWYKFTDVSEVLAAAVTMAKCKKREEFLGGEQNKAQ